MLKELGDFVEALQWELRNRGVIRPEEAVQVEIKCRSIAEWHILDQAVEQDFRDIYGDWRTLLEPIKFNRVMVPHMLTYKMTPIRITYNS